MHKLSTSVMCLLCNQNFTLPIQWTMAMNFPRTITHAIDFSPGDTGSICHLTVCNLNGCGVCVIVGRRVRVVLRFMACGIFTMKIGVARNEDLSLYAQCMKILAMLNALVTDGMTVTVLSTSTYHTPVCFKCPIVVTGLTSATVKAGFIGTILSARFHVKLASGGHYHSRHIVRWQPHSTSSCSKSWLENYCVTYICHCSVIWFL